MQGWWETWGNEDQECREGGRGKIVMTENAKDKGRTQFLNKERRKCNVQHGYVVALRRIVSEHKIRGQLESLEEK